MKKLFTFIVCASLSAGIYAADFFVDGAVATSGDGLSWETAKKTIPEALTLAKTNNATSQDDNIHVKAGTYMGATASTVPLDLTHVDCTGISLFGGYAAASSGTDITQRNISINATIVDGQATANVVKISQRVTLDGFVIQNGKDASYTQNAVSAGIALSHSNALVSNCIIKNNSRTTGNNKSMAGGVFIKAGTLRGCEIFGNSTTHANSQAGGIQITGGTIERCKIYNNTAGSVGQVGGILVAKATATINVYALLDNNITLANNIIYNNAYQGIKVGLIAGETKTVSLINNTIVNNAAVGAFEGAGIAQLTATNNILYNNGGAEMLAGTYTYNAIQAAEVSGTGNIALTATDNSQTLFILPSTVTGKSTDASVELANWSLGSTSVCKDAGTGSGFGTTDIAGNDRVAGTSIDMGAYESSVSTAINTQSRTVSTVYSRQGGIEIGNASAYEIYSIDGRKLESGLSAAFVPMATGVYVVKTVVGSSREVTKVIVR